LPQHPSFFLQSNWIEDEGHKRDFKIQLKRLLSDTVSPVSDKKFLLLLQKIFFKFFLSDPAKPDEVHLFLRDP
jgi:hypothetical protein